MAKIISQVLCLLSSGLSPEIPVRSVRNESRFIWWNPVPLSSPPADFVFYQGDILLPANDVMRNAVKVKQYLWPNRTIPYELKDDFDSTEEELIRSAMATIEANSCIRFVEKDSHYGTFISFQKKNSGCYAPIGRFLTNRGPLPVNLQAPECFERGIIEHELLHVVGLFHEQARPDRDEYVTVHWCNVAPQNEKDFAKVSDLMVDTYGLPYDFSSIMHYPRWAFSKNGHPTITAKADPDMVLGQRQGPTDTDFKKLEKMYPCDEPTSSIPRHRPPPFPSVPPNY